MGSLLVEFEGPYMVPGIKLNQMQGKWPNHCTIASAPRKGYCLLSPDPHSSLSLLPHVTAYDLFFNLSTFEKERKRREAAAAAKKLFF